ncbi:sugar O-acetyltransferase [Luteococcus peritonei]|uniref:Sugar O-acetyltransferase n=1 Tax=Luteococcus peritonei TaxID=88874 RepID=A0ABW4RZH7_9ACTN
MNDVLQRCLDGGFVDFHDPSFREVERIVAENARLCQELNASPHSLEEVRQVVEQMTGRPVDESTSIALPFRTDFGRHIFLGKDVFINTDCLFVDLGGIHIADKVLIAPRVSIITVNHDIDPERRRSVVTAGVRIERNAWIGAGATLCPGVTVGENSVVGAGSVVTKDVPANVVVAGVPAKVVKQL